MIAVVSEYTNHKQKYTTQEKSIHHKHAC